MSTGRDWVSWAFSRPGLECNEGGVDFVVNPGIETHQRVVAGCCAAVKAHRGS